MARRLKMAEVNTIRTLHKSGHSNREIARLVGVHRETVARYVAAEDLKPAKPDHRVPSGPANACEAFHEQILAKLEQGLSGVRIHQDLVDEHRFSASYSSVRRYLQGLRKSHPAPFRRMECEPGEEAQVDFGTAAVVERDGQQRRPWLFRIVLTGRLTDPQQMRAAVSRVGDLSPRSIMANPVTVMSAMRESSSCVSPSASR